MPDQIESSENVAAAHDDAPARPDDRISPGVPAASVAPASAAGAACADDESASSSMPSKDVPTSKKSDRSRLYGALSVAFALVAAVAILAGAGYGAGFFGSGSDVARGGGNSATTESAQGSNQNASAATSPSSSTNSSADQASSSAGSKQTAADSASSSNEKSSGAAATSATSSSSSENTSSSAGSPSSETGSAPSTSTTQGPAELVDVPDTTPTEDTSQTDENGKIKVTVSVDSSRIAAYGIDPFQVEQVVELDPGASVYDALCALNLPVSGTSYYVSAINGLAERQGGQGSGWTYSVNGEFPSKSCGKYFLAGGEQIAWIYSTEKDPTLVMK